MNKVNFSTNVKGGGGVNLNKQKEPVETHTEVIADMGNSDKETLEKLKEINELRQED